MIPPVPDHDDTPFWDGVREGRLLLQRCADCHTTRHPPSPMCARCHSVRHEWFDASGNGRVYSWIASRHPNATEDEAPRIVALIDLDEGVRMVSNLLDVDLADVHAGLPVRVTFVDCDGTTLPQFVPAEVAR